MPDVDTIIPTFFVKDLEASLAWYQRVLGFAIDFQTADYAGVTLGPVTIHLAHFPKPPPGKWLKGACYLRLRAGLDEYVADIVAKGQGLTATLKDHPEYGMREATVRDPDDNDIYIGQPL